MTELEPQSAPAGAVSADFANISKRVFQPTSARTARENEEGLNAIAKRVLVGQPIVADSATEALDDLIAGIDRMLTEQINEILHHAEFQQLEAAWAGLHHLLSNTETDKDLKVLVQDVTKEELRTVLRQYRGTRWNQSPVFRAIYSDEYGTLGGEPFGCLVGDFYFDHSPTDVQMLGEIAKIAGAAHTPFLTGADPSLLGMHRWTELNDPPDLAKIFQKKEYIEWNALRESEDARFLGLTLPRFLARLPYGSKSDPVGDFDFEEGVTGDRHDRYCWANSAYAMAANVTRAFKDYGWCAQIRGVTSGGTRYELPCHRFETEGGMLDLKCPTEITIPEVRELQLANCGLMALVHRKNTSEATFMSAQSLQKPQEFDDADATANAVLTARLPYLFAASRFAHFLKVKLRDMIGQSKSEQQIGDELQDWIDNYISDPSVGEEAKAKRPLAWARVVLEGVEENPGFYTARLFLQPHYQLEGIKLSVRLVARAPEHAE